MIHQKLMTARSMLHALPLKKSGWNDFSKYDYFELKDFLPQTLKILQEINVCSVISFDIDYARLCLTDIEDGTTITITSPMAEAALKGAHAIQNLGAVQTYQRRYLWVAAMEIVENDLFDLTYDKKAAPKEEQKPEVKPAPKVATKKEVEKVTAGKPGEWQITLKETEGGDWAQAILDAVEVALELAKSADDVNNIFRVNKLHFDRLKEETPTVYADALELLKKFKNSFKE